MGIDKVGKKWWVQNHHIQNKVDGWTWPGQPQSKVRIFLLYKEKKGKNRRVSVANSNLPPFGHVGWVSHQISGSLLISFTFFHCHVGGESYEPIVPFHLWHAHHHLTTFRYTSVCFQKAPSTHHKMPSPSLCNGERANK